MAKFGGGKAVFQLISEQAEHLVSAADILSQVAHAEPTKRAELNLKLHDVENLADEANHKVQRMINNSFVLPYDRVDLYALVSLVDDCIDLIDEAGDDIVLYGVQELPEEALKLVQIINDCAHTTTDAISNLKKLDEKTRAYWVGINQLENHGDTIYRSLISKLFNAENAQPMEVLKMKFVVDTLESAIDSFENLAGLVESIAIKES
ncbi:DUF47 domain-containing protein [Arcanobacterium hippocoleae]|uniref:Phosphate transport protein (TIGR00153 family) n=1 Tax=Arcanobacterium hippocoleae TaxID=149017 RepID=A0ABU1T1U2_9ACTO|nr:DUF47 family protein [Arcanobacterium hippocoleae]MDR6939338.1 putative phosphate transport protein (TIGR00153 family) [Arcanobacterium hippocoleae]